MQVIQPKFYDFLLSLSKINKLSEDSSWYRQLRYVPLKIHQQGGRSQRDR